MPKVETWRKRKGLKSIGLTSPPLSTMRVGDAKLNADVAFGRVPNGDLACVECGYHVHAPGCPKVKRDAETQRYLEDTMDVERIVERAVCLISARRKATAELVDTGVWEFSVVDGGERYACQVVSTTILAYARGERGASRLADHVLGRMKSVGPDEVAAKAVRRLRGYLDAATGDKSNAELFSPGAWSFYWESDLSMVKVESNVILAHSANNTLHVLAGLILEEARRDAAQTTAQTFSNTLSNAWKPNIEALRKAREEWKLKMERNALAFGTRLPLTEDSEEWKRW